MAEDDNKPEEFGPRDDEPTWPLARFRALYDKNDNVWWMISCGHHMNLFDAACEEIDRLRAQLMGGDQLVAEGRAE